MSVNDATLFLPGEVVKDLPQQGSYFSVDRLATILGEEHDMLLALPRECARLCLVPVMASSPFDSSQQTTEGELYAGNAQSSSGLTGEPVAYLLMVSYSIPQPASDHFEF